MMSSPATALSRVLLLLVILGAPFQAAATTDPEIGLLVVTDSTNPNAFCTETENAYVGARLLEDVFGYEDDSSDDEDESDDSRDESDDRRELKHGRRRLGCRTVCRGFPPGHCRVVYPKCRGWRFLEGGEGQEQRQERENGQIRGNVRKRKLGDDSDDSEDFDSGWYHSSGKWVAWDETHPEAHQQCLTEKVKLQDSLTQLYGVNSSLGDPCKLLLSDHVQVGCLNMGGLGSG